MTAKQMDLTGLALKAMSAIAWSLTLGWCMSVNAKLDKIDAKLQVMQSVMDTKHSTYDANIMVLTANQRDLQGRTRNLELNRINSTTP